MKKIIKSLSGLIAAVMIAASLLPAEAFAAAGSRRNLLDTGSDYTAILYDSTNGLPTSEANAIAQTSDGFIWLGGYSGLIRYDGTTFERFDSSTGISSVYSLFVDSGDRLWIGTNENGIALYDHGDLKIYGRVEGMNSYSVRAIVEDEKGNILIATTQGMCYIDTDLEIHTINEPLVNTEYIECLDIDEAGRVFGLTQDGEVFEMKNLRISAFYNSGEFGSEIISSLYCSPDSPGIIYMGTTGSNILTVNADDNMNVLSRRYTYPQSNINATCKTGNILWMAAGNGIGYLDENSIYHELADSPLNNSVGTIMSDHEGNMWFTSTRQGVLKLVPDRFTDFSRLADLDNMVVNTTAIKDGVIYLGTDTGLVEADLTTYDKKTDELTELLSGVRIRCIYMDSAGNIWICTKGKLGLVCRKKDGSILTFNEENGIDTNHVRDITELDNGAMAVATSNGLYIIENFRVNSHYDRSEGIITSEILCVEEGPDGTLYLGSDGDGIYVLSGGRVSRLSYDDGLTSGVVMRVKYDSERDMFWLVTSNSLEYIKDGVITAVSDFPYSNNYDIYFDNRGGAWVLSSNGIYIISVDELMNGGLAGYTFYNTKSGLPYIATSNSRDCIDEDGVLYIAGTSGVCTVDINAAPASQDTVKLAIPSVELDDEAMSTEGVKKIKIPSSVRRLTIDSYVITYGLNNPKVSYYLEGFEQTPVLTTKQDMKPVTYTNLSGGTYVFHFNLLNSESEEIERSVSLIVEKEYSLLENWVFRLVSLLLVIVLITVLVYAFFSGKNKALIKKREEDRKFINQIIYTFARCIDIRDAQNRGHSFRVAYYTKKLAEKLAFSRGYTDEDINEFYNIALLHDIGKLAIPDSILNKPSRLDDEEYEVMKSHAALGEDILKDVNIVKDLAVGAGCHHERMDGKGYPHGLKGSEIPEVARIIAVADTFDAMYSTRPYREQMLLSDVIGEIKRIKGTQLEEDVVDALLSLASEGVLDREKVDAFCSQPQ